MQSRVYTCFLRFPRSWLLGIILLFALVTACDCGKSVGKACESNAVCPTGEVCHESACVPGCANLSDCGEGKLCEGSKCLDDACLVGTERGCALLGKDQRPLGVCSGGTETCVQGGTAWSTCSAPAPQAEICDLLDNDCDGKVDEGDDGLVLACDCPTPGAIRRCYPGDMKTNQVGDCTVGVQYCLTSNTWGKCHDAVLPRAEFCDGKDNDCNGKIDDKLTCDCEPGIQRECYSGPVSTVNRGTCKRGKQTCGTDRKWSSCEGQITPRAEENQGCNALDDDCDGLIDEKADGIGTIPACEACTQGETRDCYSGSSGTLVGACKRGKQTCKDKVWGKCEGEVIPSLEVCDDAIDNDCDGNVDEGCNVACKDGDTRQCYDGPQFTLGHPKGACQIGQQTCVNKKWSSCLNQVLPTKEVCQDDRDNDCDGQLNEDCTVAECSKEESPRSCYSGPDITKGVGPCKSGIQTCEDGKWSGCVDAALPQPETCNGLDDDCDGRIDGMQATCYTGIPDLSWKNAPCKRGKAVCENGAWGQCQGETIPKAEECNDQDDDCNGKVDDNTKMAGTTCTKEGAFGPCKTGLFACNLGTLTCVTPTPVPEVCNNGIDDDCDGVPDGPPCTCEGSVPRACYTGPIPTKDVGLCKGGMQACVGGKWEACKGEITPATESCNNMDDNCDGKTDEGLTQTCYTGSADTQGKGVCRDGTKSCSSGTWGACTNQKLPSIEICNGLDDDCNGKTDDLAPRDCYSGDPKTLGKGLCKKGTQSCIGGLWGSCVGEIVPGIETCNTVDDDCDGQVDENVCTGCQSGQMRNCYTGPPNTRSVGLCRDGMQFCTNGQWSSCGSQVTPQAEMCDGNDNDCDGASDEDCECKFSEMRACYTGPAGTLNKAKCYEGTQFCVKGKWEKTCHGQALPKPEICNGEDDDCNGMTDDGIPTNGDCYNGMPQGTVGVGPCKKGTKTCEMGYWMCKGEVLPQRDLCGNGIDDDCNGMTDDDPSCFEEPPYDGPTNDGGPGGDGGTTSEN